MWQMRVVKGAFLSSIWGTFPSYLLHFGANISHTHCSPHLCVAFLFLILYPAAALCVAGVALGDIHLHFAWQARHLSPHWAGSGGALGRRWSPALCMAGVALGDIHLLWCLFTASLAMRICRFKHIHLLCGQVPSYNFVIMAPMTKLAPMDRTVCRHFVCASFDPTWAEVLAWRLSPLWIATQLHPHLLCGQVPICASHPAYACVVRYSVLASTQCSYLFQPNPNALTHVGKSACIV